VALQRSLTHRVQLLAASLLLLASCNILGLDANSDDADRLRAARLRWQRQRPEAYSYVLERLCFCGRETVGPVRIQVRGDSVLSRTYTGSGEPVSLPFRQYFGPMETVFDVVSEALERDADSLAARYDPARGYPVSVVIDYIENAVDDELTVRVSEFRTLLP
jgi:hypothetical protein